MAAPQKITVSKYFFTELKTPFAATRSEVIKIPVQIFNAGDTDEETILEISNNEDDLILIDSDTRQFMLPANDIHVEWFKFRVAGIGPTKVRSTAFAIYDSNNKSDAMEKTIKLKAEGIAKQVSYTSYKCTTGAEKSFHEILSAPPAGTQNLVPDSVRNKLSITDNLFGNAFDNLDNLVTVPSGCGEQNMVGVVPNIAVANFLADPEDPTRISAIEKAQYGYERELKYQRKDGSFSAFGDSDKEGSTWLTAFVIRSFVEGADFLTIDYENVMKPALRYLLDSGVQKDKTLMFPNTGRLFHGFYNEDSVKGIFKDMHMTVTGILAIERVLEKNVLPEMKTELKNAKTMAWNWIQKAKEENCQGVSNCNWENGANINIYTLGHILYAASVSVA